MLSGSMLKNHQRALKELLPGRVFVGHEISDKYSVDWSAENACRPSILVRAKSVDDVSLLLEYCNAHRLAVVTQGGLTGLAGGATPQANEIALSLELCTGITDVDVDSMTISAFAGTPLAAIQQAALDAGYCFPLDLGARDSCTIGGNVATNAGGNQVLSYGMTRALVLGIEAVTADGSIIRSMNKMLKNNAGYDLKHLFIGSEGTLGVVTEVVLRMYPLAVTKNSALCAFDKFSDVVDFLHSMQRSFSRVTAFELMWSNYIDIVVDRNPSIKDPFIKKYPLYVLIEVEGNKVSSGQQEFEQLLFEEMETGKVVDAVVAQSKADADKFWDIRDGVIAILSQVQYRANFDVGVPVSKMEGFIERVECLLSKKFENLMFCAFGHMADGNLHILAWTGVAADVENIYRIVYEVIGEIGGTVTAEHGVGVMKRKYLSYCRSSEEISLMETLKKALDPNNILNPERIL